MKSNIILRDVALKAFTKEELETKSFKDIKTFQDACKTLSLDYNSMLSINQLKSVSRASVAMFKLNIIRKALNFSQDLNLTTDSKDSRIYYPFNPIMTTDATYYKKEIKANMLEIIGNIKNEGIPYKILGGAYNCGYVGLGCFDPSRCFGFADANSAFLGCATKEIAEYFSKYFGMLITEAKYGDLPDFEIIENKYQ